MILGQLRMGARQAKNAPLDSAWNYAKVHKLLRKYMKFRIVFWKKCATSKKIPLPLVFDGCNKYHLWQTYLAHLVMLKLIGHF